MDLAKVELLQNMDLHETKVVRDDGFVVTVMRVTTGWIYTTEYDLIDGDTQRIQIFVPDTRP